MSGEYDFSKCRRGAVIPQKGKTRISIFIDNAVLDDFRARADKAGTGYQTTMNDALRKYLSETDQVRQIIESKDFTVLATHPMFSTRDFKAVPAKYRALVPEYANMTNPAPTERQGQFLAYIHQYGILNGCAPSEADTQRYFQVTPPSVHTMVLTLERRGFIRRVPAIHARRNQEARQEVRRLEKDLGRR